MNKLQCDIKLGGSTTQFLTYGKRQSSEKEFIRSINKALYYRAKTRPKKLATRLACLIGITYDQLDGDQYILDCIISAFYLKDSK